MHNLAAFIAVVLVILSLLLGTALYGDQVWWWEASAIIFVIFPFTLSYMRRARSQEMSIGTARQGPQQMEPTMKNISPGAFLGNAIIYLAIVAFVAVSLFSGLVLGETVMSVNLFNTMVHPIVYLVPLALVAIWTQRSLSATRGLGRVIDWLISMAMLIVVAAIVALWAKLPYADVVVKEVEARLGVALQVIPSTYKLAVVLIFGIPALFDVLGRDILGIGRGGRVVSIGADSTFEVSARPRVKLDSPWELELPNGRVMPFVPNEQMLERFEREVARRLPAPGAGTPPASSAGT